MLALLLLFLCLLRAVLSAPAEPAELIQVSKRQGGYYWQNWSEGNGNWDCRNGNGGSYSVTWSGRSGGFVCGKGWNYGGERIVKYSGTYTPTGPGYLAVYGWTRNPLIEYYVVESYDVLAPGEPWTKKGTFTSGDEGTYDVYTSQRVNKPSIEGTRTFMQFWSVRTEKRVGGTVTMKNHFEAWGKLGMKLGAHSYVVLATEGFTNGSLIPSGRCELTVG